MAHIKSVSGYRRSGLTYNAAEDEVKRKDAAYLDWLATREGWTTDEKPCRHCNGTGNVESYGYGGRRRNRNRKPRPCSYCVGGTITLAHPVLDIAKAREYVETQRSALEKIADMAVSELKLRLFWLGFRPLLSRVRSLQTVAEYDENRRQYRVAHDAMTAMFERVQVDAERYEVEMAAALEAGEEWTEASDRIRATMVTWNDADALRNQLYQFGDAKPYQWYRPGGEGSKTVYVGTSPARHHYGYVKPDVSIIIEPGRAPSTEEIDRLVDEAIATISDADDILLAA